MANLIITVIAIALVAVAALMGAYYGGAAFLNNQQNVIASTVMNQGEQLAGAWQAYLADNMNTSPSDAGALITSNYIKTWPIFPYSAGSSASGSYVILSVGTHYYAAAVVGSASATTPGFTDPAATACLRIVAIVQGSRPTAMPQLDVPTLVLGGVNIGTTSAGCGMIVTPGTYTILPNSIAGIPATPGSITYVSYYLLT